MNTLIISPTYNEKKNISELINRITLISTEIDLLIIDDNSPDGTADIVKSYMVENKHIFILERERIFFKDSIFETGVGLTLYRIDK